ncbi:MAG: hypothetical protein ACI9R3_006247 [Verrucomicrobiales bacterium]|jgi:hypothetical protein
MIDGRQGRRKVRRLRCHIERSDEGSGPGERLQDGLSGVRFGGSVRRKCPRSNSSRGHEVAICSLPLLLGWATTTLTSPTSPNGAKRSTKYTDTAIMTLHARKITARDILMTSKLVGAQLNGKDVFSNQLSFLHVGQMTCVARHPLPSKHMQKFPQCILYGQTSCRKRSVFFAGGSDLAPPSRQSGNFTLLCSGGSYGSAMSISPATFWMGCRGFSLPRCSGYLPFLILAQRAFCAATIRARPSGLI